jgi:hypothetical protein
MSSQQPAQKASLWKKPGFMHVLAGGSSLLAAAVLYFLVSFPHFTHTYSTEPFISV